METLKEVVEALRPIDKEAADYIDLNFSEEDFKYGVAPHGEGRELGPLDFFSWGNEELRKDYEWEALNNRLMDCKEGIIEPEALEIPEPKERKIIGYQLVSCQNPIDFSLKIRKGIGSGFEFYGGLIIKDGAYHREMVKYK